jgi:hypothetical protein
MILLFTILLTDTTFTTREGQTRSGVRRRTQSTQGRVRDPTVTTLSGIFFLRLFFKFVHRNFFPL